MPKESATATMQHPVSSIWRDCRLVQQGSPARLLPWSHMDRPGMLYTRLPPRPQKWYRTRSMTEIQPRSFIEHQPGCQYHWHS